MQVTAHSCAAEEDAYLALFHNDIRVAADCDGQAPGAGARSA